LKRKLLIIPGVAVLLTATGVWIAGGSLSKAAPARVGELPSDLTGRNVEFASESGSMIHGWFLPGRAGQGAVVLTHGVRANRLAMLGRARFLSRAGFAVLLFDFQAHGESHGSHITFGYLESRDAQAAVRFLRANAPGEKIGVIGASLGGAAALLASPALEVDALVLEMVYPTIDQAVQDRLKLRFGSWAGIFSPLLTWQLKPRLGVSPNALRPIDQVAKIDRPKLFIVGDLDQHTTIAESQQMFARANAPKELWVVAGAAHIDLHQFSRAEYEHRVEAFFARYLRSTAPSGVSSTN
jgi:fermentation-respiration switch protein FrsA (DUF1100 family)